jgi:excinuclease UvrABC nuclease subunit
MEAEVAVRAEDYAHTRKLQWLALSQTPGIGAGRGRKLVEHFGTIERIFTAPLTELEAAGPTRYCGAEPRLGQVSGVGCV